jgi:putative ABC transport system substrate-binding protein
MRRRDFAAMFGSAAALPLAAYAEQAGRTRRIALLLGAGGDAEGMSWLAEFRAKLASFGWTDGRNATLDVRWGGADIAHIQAMAAELVRSSPDVILVYSIRVLNAMRRATEKIPVVFIATSDPVGLGIVQSLAHPGGNLTGFMLYEVSVAGKLAELLKEVQPDLKRVALLFNPENLSAPGYWKAIETVAAPLGMTPLRFPVRDEATIGDAMEAFARVPAGGIVLPTDVTTVVHRGLIIALAERYKLPVAYSFRADVASGGLISYGPDTTDLFHRAASYVDRILRGEKPGDLPVQAPTKFELAINMKTAKTLGIAVPRTILVRADDVIE